MAIIEVQQLRKEYGTLTAVNNLDLSVEPGQVWGLIGPNGAGKTTLLRMLATLLEPTSGEVRVRGYDLRTEFLSIRRHIGFLPDFFTLYNDLTLRECVSYFALAYGVDKGEVAGRVESALEFVELTGKADDLVRHLSRGMVQRLGVASLIVHDPDVYLLDEPASGLDPRARTRLRQVLARLAHAGKTVIISSHILTELSGFCSHIAVMDHGRLVRSGDVNEVRDAVMGIGRALFTVLGDSGQAVEIVDSFEGARVVEVRDQTLVLDMDASPEARAALNVHLMNGGVRVSSIGQEEAGLEEVFMAISDAGLAAEEQEQANAE